MPILDDTVYLLKIQWGKKKMLCTFSFG